MKINKKTEFVITLSEAEFLEIWAALGETNSSQRELAIQNEFREYNRNTTELLDTDESQALYMSFDKEVVAIIKTYKELKW